MTQRYVAADPFEYDIKQLRSEGHDAVVSRHWMQVSDDNFGRGYSGRTFIAADRPDQVPQIVAALRARDVGVPPDLQTIGAISSILDVVPNGRQEHRARHLARQVLVAVRRGDALDRRTARGRRVPSQVVAASGNRR